MKTCCNKTLWFIKKWKLLFKWSSGKYGQATLKGISDSYLHKIIYENTTGIRKLCILKVIHVQVTDSNDFHSANIQDEIEHWSFTDNGLPWINNLYNNFFKLGGFIASQ